MFIQKLAHESSEQDYSFIRAEKWDQPKCPSISEWINKMWHNYMMEHYLIKKDEVT